MAKTKSEKTVNTSKKIMKDETKKLTTKEPLKKVTTKKVEKIEMKPAPKKVTTKELKKIAAKTEPKRVTTKKVEKIEMKKEVDNKDTKKKSVKKSTVKKAITSTEKKEVVKAKPVSSKKTYYDAMSLEDCIMNMQKMNVHYHYEDYAQLLCDEADMNILIKNIHEGNHLQDLTLDYKVDGYDQDLVQVTLEKVKASIDVSESDFKDLKKAMDKSLKFIISNDPEKNAEAYLHEFHLCERIMMLAKRRHLQLQGINEVLNTDVAIFTKHFMDLAYDLLPTWKYEDIVFYEDFMYSYVSLFDELYLMYEQRVQLDCADLYILVNDYDRGNACYNYLLRENEWKDYIYYRFAHIYETIDMSIAKNIAQDALRFVDDRFVYYPNIIEILNK